MGWYWLRYWELQTDRLPPKRGRQLRVESGTDGESAGLGNCPQGAIGQSVWLGRSNLSQPGAGQWEQSEGVEMSQSFV